jgi:hypothetical protein
MSSLIQTLHFKEFMMIAYWHRAVTIYNTKNTERVQYDTGAKHEENGRNENFTQNTKNTLPKLSSGSVQGNCLDRLKQYINKGIITQKELFT